MSDLKNNKPSTKPTRNNKIKMRRNLDLRRQGRLRKTQLDKLRKTHFANRKISQPRMRWTKRPPSELSRNALKQNEQNKNACASSNCVTKRKPRRMQSVKGKSLKEISPRSLKCLQRLPKMTMTTFASKLRKSTMKLVKNLLMHHHS